MQPVRLRKTTENDLDYVLGAEHSKDNSPFVIPWSREQHTQALLDPNCAHLIAETDKRIGYAILLDCAIQQKLGITPHRYHR